MVWNHKSMPAGMVVSSAMQLLQAWSQARQQESPVVGNKVSLGVRSKWSKPAVGWIKMNVDAGVCENNGAYSAVLHDEQGLFCGGYVLKFAGIHDPAILEALAIREALSWIKERGKSCVIIESDCLVVFQQIHTKHIG